MTRSKKPATTDAVEILQRRYVDGDPELAAMIEQELANARIAEAVYLLRTRLKLSQRALADRVCIAVSVIRDLEDGCYTGHSATMLQRIAAACNQELVMNVEFVPRAAERTKRRRPVAASIR